MTMPDGHPSTMPSADPAGELMSGPGSRIPRQVGARAATEAQFPNALQHAFDHVCLDSAFFDRASRAARQAGCELLFEIPSVLLSDPVGRAAAIRCGEEADAELFFLLFKSGSGEIAIIEASEVAESVLDFTRSYAGVLSLIGSDRRLVAPLLQ